MTGNERILAALARDGRETWPLDLGGSTVTGIASGILARLLAARGLPAESLSADTVQGIALPGAEVLAALGSDTLRIGVDRVRGPLRALDGGGLETVDDFGVTWRRAPGELYFSQAGAPLAEGSLGEALARYRFPEPDLDRLAPVVEAGRRDAERLGLFPLLDRDCAGLFEMSARLRGLERLYMDFYDDPEGVEALAEALLAYKLRYWTGLLGLWTAASAAAIPTAPGPADASPGAATTGATRAAGATAAGMAEADDYGSELSLLVAPATIRDTYLSRYARLFAAAREALPEVRIVFHSCGAIRDIIPDLADAGVDALNPVQYVAAGMEAAGLKRDFGGLISFWGGAVDTKRVLPGGRPDEVRAEVRRQAALLGAGGGLVLATVHNIQEDVPLPNLLAYLEAVEGLRSGEAPR